MGIPAEKICVVSIMPCTAKKYEANLDTMRSAGFGQDVDIVITTPRTLRHDPRRGVLPERLEEEEFDSILGDSTGAAVIFGATGGVMEAALRSAYYLVTGKTPIRDAFKAVRGPDGWKEASFELPGRTLKCAVVHGLGNARRLIEALKDGTHQYDFVEVMACPGGCAGGGGQPICSDDNDVSPARTQNLYALDAAAQLRFSHENPSIKTLYQDFLGRPGSELAHAATH